MPTTSETKFIVGRTYRTRSACDYDCIFAWEVVARTEKQLTLSDRGNIFKRGIRTYNGVETCRPLGTYSMCPVISADREEA